MNKLPIHSWQVFAVVVGVRRHKNVSRKHGIYEPPEDGMAVIAKENLVSPYIQHSMQLLAWVVEGLQDDCLGNRIFALNYMLWQRRCRFLSRFLLGEPKVNSKITFFERGIGEQAAGGKVLNVNPPHNRIMCCVPRDQYYYNNVTSSRSQYR